MSAKRQLARRNAKSRPTDWAAILEKLTREQDDLQRPAHELGLTDVEREACLRVNEWHRYTVLQRLNQPQNRQARRGR